MSLIAGFLVVAASPAVAAPAWSITPSPQANRISLTDVSCPSTKSCFASGYTDEVPAVEHWNGKMWSIMTVPKALGANRSWLNAMSCPRTNSCYAVGGTDTNRSLAVHWNGVRWSRLATPISSGAISVSLTAISCPSASACLALGLYTTPPEVGHDLALRWDGSRWSTIASPKPKRGSFTDGGLSDVSCPRTNSCFAVGTHYFKGDFSSFVAHWNGSRWSVMSSPNRNSESNLEGVSCPRTDNCYAVGRSFTSSTTETLVEHWNGKRWSLMTSIDPAPVSELFGVSCANANSCFAVGGTSPSSSATTSKTLVEHWNGRHWSKMTSPNPVGFGSGAAGLGAVSCPSTSACIAVGSRAKTTLELGQTLVERYS